MKRQAAVFVTAPVEDAVDPFRRRHHPRAIARLLPPHVTVLPPFVRDLDVEDLVARLGEHFATIAPFPAELARVGHFSRHAWLAPEPHERFHELLLSSRERFSELVTDEDHDPVPHLTIAELRTGESIAAVVAAAEMELGPQFPLRFEVRDVALYEARPEGWHEVCRLPLA